VSRIFQGPVDLCHQHGIAVIVALSTAHTEGSLSVLMTPYTRLSALQREPLYGVLRQDYFQQPSGRAPIQPAAHARLLLHGKSHNTGFDVYHVDGFPYYCGAELLMPARRRFTPTLFEDLPAREGEW